MSLTSSQINNSLINIQNNTSKVNHEHGQKNLGSDRLDKHAFLQLLMAKLQNQDPMNPVQDNEFLTQQAQLAQVEKLDDLLGTMKGTNMLGQASGMIGKMVEIYPGNDEPRITGIVDSALYENGTAGLSVNGTKYTLDQVTKVFNALGGDGS